MLSGEAAVLPVDTCARSIFMEIIPCNSSDDALVLDHLDVVMHQRSLSGKIEDHDLSVLLDKVSLPDKAHLLFISSPHADAWPFPQAQSPS